MQKIAAVAKRYIFGGAILGCHKSRLAQNVRHSGGCYQKSISGYDYLPTAASAFANLNSTRSENGIAEAKAFCFT
jgi:hypothetical protein